MNWLVQMGVLRRLLVSLLAAVLLLLVTPNAALAQVHQHNDEAGAPMLRSFESLRDLDYDSWQAVAYRTGKPGNPVVLRIVGYPGKVRLDHPVSMLVQAGVKGVAIGRHHPRESSPCSEMAVRQPLNLLSIHFSAI